MIALVVLQAAVAAAQLPGVALLENEYVACLKEAGKYPRINTVPPDPSSRSELASRIVAECETQRVNVGADWQEHPEKIGLKAKSRNESAAFAKNVLDWITDNYRQTFVMMPQAAPSNQPN